MPLNYREKEDISKITFPEGFDEENRMGCKQPCCERFLALASTTSNDRDKNDHFGWTIKTGSLSDIVTFSIEKCGITGALVQYGLTPTYPEDELAVGFVWDWKQYLTDPLYGVGKYTTRVDFTIAGEVGGYEIAKFELKEYSIESARSTVRLETRFNSKYQRVNIDFTNSDFFDMIRLKGFFGNREPQTEINQLITKGRVSQKITRENLNKFTLRTDPLGIQYTRRLLGDVKGKVAGAHLIAGNEVFITDHSAFNHDYLLTNIPLVIDESPEVDYLELDRHAKLTATFGDRKKLDKSYFNLKV